MRALLVFCLGAVCLSAQSNMGPRCEPIPEVGKALQEVWNDETHPMPGRLEWQSEQSKRLIEKYPREVALHRRYFLLYRQNIPEKVDQIRQQYLAQAEKNPQDALAVFMAGLALENVDTPKAIETMERAIKLDPGLGWSYLVLAYLYAYGKVPDKARAAEIMTVYVKRCPQNLEGWSLGMVNHLGTLASLELAAKSIRERLEATSDPQTIESFPELWGLEFKTIPVAEHPKERERVAADLKRLENLNPKPDPEWIELLIDAMKQSGKAKDVPAVEDRIVREFSGSLQAFRIVVRRWDEARPRPKPADSAETWDTYTKAHMEAVNGWMKQFPDQEMYGISNLFADTEALPNPDPARLRELGDRFVRLIDVKYGASATARTQVAGTYLRYGIDPVRAVELLESARPLMLKDRALQQRDNLSDTERTDLENWRDSTDLDWAGAMAAAFRRAGMGVKAAPLRAQVEAVKPTKPEMKARRFAALAEISAAEGKYTDALTLIKAALDTRPSAPPLLRGRPNDQLLEQAHDIWMLSGGSAELWAMWSKPPEHAALEIADFRWEQPRKPLPPFELTDLGGRKWSLKALEGKTLFINLWATWCGPCKAELPFFQKLYDDTKDRSDVAVLSFNMDDEVGLVEPFMKEQNLSFPALPAASYVNQVVDLLGIPQNWIVDRAGVWQWQQLGYGGDPDWEKSMLEKIAATTRNPNPQVH